MADCVNCGAGSAVLGYGTTVEAKKPGTESWVILCGLTDINGPSAQRGEIDVTTLCSTAKESVLDLKDFGTLDMSGLLMDGNEGQILLDTLFNSNEKTTFRMTLTDDGYGNGPVQYIFDARVQSQPVTIAQGAANKVSFTLRITSDLQKIRPTDMGPHLTYTPMTLTEPSANSGAVTGVVSIVLAGDTFADPLAGVSFNGVPSGLTAQATRIANNTIVVSFAGAAATYVSGTTEDVGVTFADAAFATLTAAEIAGSTGRQITISFV